jgi:dihydrofolate synthase/folylpolyglutamate synthase
LGLNKVVKNTGLQGRWQQLKASPKTICDTAHNKEGLAIVLNQIQKEKYKQLHIILGVVNDKNLDEVLPLFLRRLFIIFANQTYLEDWMQLSFKKKQPNLT